MSIIVEYPRREIPWVRYCDRNGDRFLLTSNEERSRYYLYEFVGGVLKKLGAAKEPPELIERFRVEELIRV